MQGSKLWIIAAVLVVGGFIGYAVMSKKAPPPAAPPAPVTATPGTATPAAPAVPEGALGISIASSNTKEEWLHAAAQAFNEAARTNKDYQIGGRPIAVQILQEVVDGKSVDYRSGTLVADTLAGRIKPTVVSPGEESWLAKLKADWKLANGAALVSGDAPILLRTPLVIAMWQSRAKALGCFPAVGPDCTWERVRALALSPDGWKSFGHPEWRRFTLGYAYFGESNSGTLAVVAMCMAGAKKTAGLTLADVGEGTGCGKFIAGVDQAKFHAGKSDVWLIDKIVDRGPEYLDAVITYESVVIATNRKHGARLREPLVAVYPQDGTAVVGHPYAILDGAPWVTPEQVAAAKLFQAFLLGAAQQQAVLGSGLRPADPGVKLAAPIDASLGANPEARLVALEIPDGRVIDQIGEVWHRVKKHAIIVLLFDKSGSMREGGKIGAAVRGAQEFVKQMGGEDQLVWMPFDDHLFVGGVRGSKARVGEELIQQIASTRAEGGTALYDAVKAAFTELSTARGKGQDTMRYGVVILSDGKDENSRTTLAELEERLRPLENDPTGIQIHTIAIGSDADENVLRRIAGAANGRYWKGQSEKDMVRIYKEVATYW
jgi:Ca-activated chloride channel family protein